MNRKLTLAVVVCCAALFVAGCGDSQQGKVDLNKSAAAVQTEAESMDTTQLRNMATKYKNAITAKQPDVKKLADQIKEIPLTEALGDKAKKLKDDSAALRKELDTLKAHFKVYCDQLKAKGGDLSGLEL